MSPWVVNFAPNSYWVEFTWFLPMLAGLFCSINLGNKKLRLVSYAAAFAAVLAKCLCGYEYVSTVLVGLIAFLLCDIAVYLFKKDGKKAALAFRTAFVLGVVSICAFALALVIHALSCGSGMSEGFEIIKARMTERTLGNEKPESVAEYISQAFSVVGTYFNVSTSVIAGVEGYVFPVIAASPVIAFAVNAFRKRLCPADVCLYLVFFFGTASWHVLALSHSAVHVHMNYVLWYFGFVQICVYVIVKQLMLIYSSLGAAQKEKIRTTQEN